MAIIQNPTPITAETFNGMWINQLQIFLPLGAQKGFIQGRLLPYDGTHLLATGGRDVRVFDLATKRTTDAALDAVLTALVAELKRQSKKTTDIKFLNVMAPDPAKAVSAMVFFSDNTHYNIANCYALAGTDATFAGVLTNTLGEVAVLAGLTVA